MTAMMRTLIGVLSIHTMLFCVFLGKVSRRCHISFPASTELPGDEMLAYIRLSLTDGEGIEEGFRALAVVWGEGPGSSQEFFCLPLPLLASKLDQFGPAHWFVDRQFLQYPPL